MNRSVIQLRESQHRNSESNPETQEARNHSTKLDINSNVGERIKHSKSSQQDHNHTQCFLISAFNRKSYTPEH
jgi:hypothetical protein